MMRQRAGDMNKRKKRQRNREGISEDTPQRTASKRGSHRDEQAQCNTHSKEDRETHDRTNEAIKSSQPILNEHKNKNKARVTDIHLVIENLLKCPGARVDLLAAPKQHTQTRTQQGTCLSTRNLRPVSLASQSARRSVLTRNKAHTAEQATTLPWYERTKCTKPKPET